MKYTTKLLLLLDEMEETLTQMDKSYFNFKDKVKNKLEEIRELIIEWEYKEIKELRGDEE